MVIDVLEKMVPFAQEWELNSMFHPGWIKGGGSYRYWLNRRGLAVNQIFGWGHIQFIALIIREHIFSKSVIWSASMKVEQNKCELPFGGGFFNISILLVYASCCVFKCTPFEMLKCALTHAQLTQKSQLFNNWKNYEKIITNMIIKNFKIQFISSLHVIFIFNSNLL